MNINMDLVVVQTMDILMLFDGNIDHKQTQDTVGPLTQTWSWVAA